MHLPLHDDGDLWLYGTEQFRPKGLTVPVRLVDPQLGDGGGVGHGAEKIGVGAVQRDALHLPGGVEPFGAQEPGGGQQQPLPVAGVAGVAINVNIGEFS
jgi:hypothetical protein